MDIKKLGLEVLVVGIVFAALFYLMEMMDPQRKYSSTTKAFAAAAVGHLAFELAGVNAYYARYKFMSLTNIA